MSPRFELPDRLEHGEAEALLDALERYGAVVSARPSAWAMAGRIAATRQGALQSRSELEVAWRKASQLGYARRGTEPVLGRGDSK